MKPEEQKVAIAYYCKLPLFDGYSGLANHELPNYLEDLNAMHDAEKVLRNNQFHFVDYLRELWCVIHPNVKYTGDLGYIGFDFVNATASQRAEAFLRTIGKWREG